MHCRGSPTGSLFLTIGSTLTGMLLVAGAFAQPAAVPVSVAWVRSASVQDEIPLSGTVAARRFVRVSPRVEGYVQRIVVDAGDEVAVGDVLVELDKELAGIEVATAVSALKEARIRYVEALRQRDEAVQLMSKNHIADTEVATAEAEVAIYGAGVERLSSRARREQEILARHTITAPFAGVVAAKLVEVGQWVETSTALIELSEIAHLRVEVPVPQIYFAVVKAGTPVVMQFDALPGYTLDAVVSTRIPVGNTVARTFPVHIDIDNRERRLAPGMSAQVRLLANRSDHALLLPLDAIVREANGTESVWRVVVNDGVTSGVKVVVQTGRSKRDLIEVAAGGLSEGDRVVVHGNERLSDEQTIKIIEELQPAS